MKLHMFARVVSLLTHTNAAHGIVAVLARVLAGPRPATQNAAVLSE